MVCDLLFWGIACSCMHHQNVGETSGTGIVAASAAHGHVGE